MRTKELIALALVAVSTFPVVFLGVLMTSGNVRLVFTDQIATDPFLREDLQRRAPTDQELALLRERGEEVLIARTRELDQREADLQAGLARLTQVTAENEAIRDTIRTERLRLEALLQGRDTLEARRILVLAQTFAAMRPPEAAPILLRLDDVILTAILRRIDEDRTRGRLLAAVGRLSPERAAQVARVLGLSPFAATPTATPAVPADPPTPRASQP